MSGRTFTLSERAALEGDDDAYVLVDTSNATMCVCNETAWRMLGALKEGATIRELMDRLTEHFDVEPEAAERDAEAFVGQLSAMGLVDEAA